jgi:hypothetical protein
MKIDWLLGLTPTLRTHYGCKLFEHQEFVGSYMSEYSRHMIKDKTPEEVRKLFNIVINDFTPEEEEEVRPAN